MTLKRILQASALALATTAIATPALAADKPAKAPVVKKLTAEDYFEIEQLYTDYCWALDRGDGAARAATFAPGGVFISALSKHTPELASVLAARTSKGGPSATRHMMTNIKLTATADGADGMAYALIVSGQPIPGTFIGTPAFYIDKLVRTPDGWKFKSREVWEDWEKDSPYRGTIPAAFLSGVRNPQ